MPRNIALIGSSGGNLYNLGGKDPVNLVEEVMGQVEAAGIRVTRVLFVAAGASMDQVKPNTPAALYVLKDGVPTVVHEGPLAEVNDKARQLDREIAAAIEAGELDGLFLVSADPDDVNRASIRAAAGKKLVVVGTGGTSMAKVQSLGAPVIAVSGTTGTTNRTRAIAGVSALARHWNLRYRPVIGQVSGTAGGATGGSPWRRANFRGIMMASLPGFIAMALTLALSKVPGLQGLSPVFDTMIEALPVIVAAVAAKQVSGLDEAAIVAGVVAGALSVKGGIIGGIAGGVLAGILVSYLLTLCFHWRFPATTANIVAGGLSGLSAGLLVYFLLAPVALAAGNGIRELINLALNYNGILAGAVAGLLIWPAIIGGVYHAAILPIVLLEMEKTGNSFLGAIDMAGLVMVSAGITLANLIYPRTRDEATVAAPGFLVNVGFGTFVEAAYPFMFSDRLVFAAALVSATIGGTLVGMFAVRGTAYVPSVVAPAMSNDPAGFLIAMLGAMGSALCLTLLANRRARGRAATAGSARK